MEQHTGHRGKTPTTAGELLKAPYSHRVEKTTQEIGLGGREKLVTRSYFYCPHCGEPCAVFAKQGIHRCSHCFGAYRHTVKDLAEAEQKRQAWAKEERNRKARQKLAW